MNSTQTVIFALLTDAVAFAVAALALAEERY